MKRTVQENKAQRTKERKNYLDGVEQAYDDGKAAEERTCDATIKERRDAVMAKVAQIWAAHDKEVEQLKTSSKTLVGQMMEVRDGKLDEALKNMPAGDATSNEQQALEVASRRRSRKCKTASGTGRN